MSNSSPFGLVTCYAISNRGNETGYHFVLIIHLSFALYIDKDIMDRVLIEAPEQMIKFKAYKRGYAIRKTSIAYRLTRVSNQKRLPYGVWANIVVESILNTSYI